MDATLLRQRYAAVLERLDDACAAAGRKRAEVRLVAVSKWQPAEAIGVLLQCGQQDFGENYVQEALQKRSTLASAIASRDVRWHMIGHVQHRKASLVAGAFYCLHTVDTPRLALALERHLVGRGVVQDVLLQVNVAAEPQKSGVLPQDMAALAELVLRQCPHLRLCGLMCLPPVFDAGDAARPHFAHLRRLRDELRVQSGLLLPELSMGMSGDFVAAVAEGATVVRIGTDIFGPRPPKSAMGA